MTQRGFTLLETLVAITIAAVVLAGLATAVRSQAQSAVLQMGTADTSQDVRGALDLFKRDVRMAGFGMGAVPVTTLEPVKLEALGAGEVYRVRLRGAFANVVCPGNVVCTGSGSLGTITIDAAAMVGAPSPAFTVGKYVSIESPILGAAEVSTIAGWNPGARTITLTSNLTQIYATGSPVREIEDLLYVLDNQGVLRRNGAPVADQITGVNALTMQYILADGTTVADPTGSLDLVRGATMSLQATGAMASGLTPQSNLTGQVRIRNLAIATAATL